MRASGGDLDLKDKIPNASADINKNIIWHMHPWNISLDYKNNVPSFFSFEDLVIGVNYPTKKFIIFNFVIRLSINFNACEMFDFLTRKSDGHSKSPLPVSSDVY